MADTYMHSETSVGMRALELMTKALIALDESTVPADIGAHLDLAIARLRQHLESAEMIPTPSPWRLGNAGQQITGSEF